MELANRPPSVRRKRGLGTTRGKKAAGFRTAAKGLLENESSVIATQLKLWTRISLAESFEKDMERATQRHARLVLTRFKLWALFTERHTTGILFPSLEYSDRWPSAGTNKDAVPLELFINSIQRFRAIITLRISMCVFQTQGTKQSYGLKLWTQLLRVKNGFYLGVCDQRTPF